MNETRRTFEGVPVLVTGATGFLGGALTERLLAEGAQVSILARSAEKAARWAERGVRVTVGDLTDLDAVREAMRGSRIVIHSAAALDGTFDEMVPATVIGTRNVMAAAAEFSDITRVVHVSSIAIYGLFGGRAVITEDTTPAYAEYPYVRTKLMAEGEVLSAGARNGTLYTIVRPGMIYGPHAGLWTAGLFRLATTPAGAVFFGDGTGTAFPIFVDDVVDLLMTCALHPAAAGQVFNCAPDPAPSWRELLLAYQALTGRPAGWVGLPPILLRAAAAVTAMLAPRGTILRDLPDGVDWLFARQTHSMAKARDLLGWQAQVSLSEGVARCAPWLREIGLLESGS
ncbi:MAG: NAD(P)-dependent oxidoreductase [Pleurocapsa minor GSE-CHR-MK-17-07R]|jgi:nucleoside-diphosphate-sugar epimerase|nr:NAD(P)-dependent oxidoreductase [Pleurocapsa minor GSE-CHR-MK 17-07R]